MDTQKYQSVGIQITVLSSGGCNILLFLHGWNFRTGLFYSFGLLLLQTVLCFSLQQSSL